MDIDDILRMRLCTQLIEGGSPSSPRDVISLLAAAQAQDYNGALWSIGLRLPGATLGDVERAIAEGSIVRTWPMRGTLHFVAAEDVRWLLALLTPRIITRAAARHAALGQDDATFTRAAALLRDALSGGQRLTRPEAMALLGADGIATDGQRGYHVLWRLSQTGVLCCGPNAGKQQTFVLLDDWVPLGPAERDSPPRDVALARLAERFIAGHGPATLEDFAWWSGLPKADAGVGLAAVTGRFKSATVDGKRYWFPAANIAAEGPRVDLLPGFDEYMLGYTDRTLQLGDHRETYGASVSANGMFSATVVIDGRTAGTWKRTLKRDRVEVAVRTFRSLSAAETDLLAHAAERYGAYLGLNAVLTS